MNSKLFQILIVQAIGLSTAAQNKAPNYDTYIAREAQKIESQCIKWRRDFHEHPELSNRETRTAKIVADHLRGLGLEVREGVAKTGVIGILKGSKPGPVIGLARREHRAHRFDLVDCEMRPRRQRARKNSCARSAPRWTRHAEPRRARLAGPVLRDTLQGRPDPTIHAMTKPTLRPLPTGPRP